MNIEKILKEADAFLEQKEGEKAEQLLLESASQAVKEQDDASLLQLLNELLGYYREKGRTAETEKIGAQAVSLAERMGLEGTLPYATTLLNVANACRAAGRYEESFQYFQKVQTLYRDLFQEENLFTAGLYNNMSLLYQETGEFGKAKDCQRKALEISQGQDAAYETAVTCANLAATCLRLGEPETALGYAAKAVELFEKQGVKDSHYAAALASLGAYHYQRKEYRTALEYYTQAEHIVEQYIGHNQGFDRLKEHADACRKALEAAGETAAAAGESGVGLSLCREYYETFGKPMIRERFPDYQDRIAVGLVGRGSDCFGYDDEISRDHDWGPGFCLWVTDETYEQIGPELEKAYEQLPREFRGFRRAAEVNGRGRRGVWRIGDFYRSLTGADRYERIDWAQASDYGLAAAVNGQVFRDVEGIFSDFRRKLQEGYPLSVRYLKLAEAAAGFAQAAQYNYPRMLSRKDPLTGQMVLWDGVRSALRLVHYAEGKYPPHDKWLVRSIREGERGEKVFDLLEQIRKDDGQGQDAVERLGSFLAMELYGLDLISDIDPYLDAHSQELIYKASLAGKSREELAEEIARAEFEAFDKVRNEGGRASCQDDWATFSIMRKSQYLTWNQTMLMQYLYDFRREYERGHNLIEEKYGRMMESTAPGRYEQIKGHFPQLTDEKKRIIQQICAMQVGWMEEFAAQYPALAENARSIHSYEDNPFNTSYETYLRGELGTYSDKMLELYGRYIVQYAREGKNPAQDIMTNSLRMYGYESVEEAEQKTAAAAERNGQK